MSSISCLSCFGTNTGNTYVDNPKLTFALKVAGAVSLLVLGAGFVAFRGNFLSADFSKGIMGLGLTGMATSGIGLIVIRVNAYLEKQKSPVDFDLIKDLEPTLNPLSLATIKKLLSKRTIDWSLSFELGYHLSVLSENMRGGAHVNQWRKFLVSVEQVVSCESQRKILDGQETVLSPPSLDKQPLPINLNTLSDVETAINTKEVGEACHKLRIFFSSSPIVFKNQFDLHELHDALTTLTLKIQTDKTELLGEWTTFLESIHQNVQFIGSSGERALLDCSLEIARLKDNWTGDYDVMELTEKEAELEDYKQIYSIMSLSFETTYRFNTVATLKDYMFSKLQHCYIARERKTKDIVGFVFTQETEPGKVFFHTLARRPDASKIGIVAKFFESYFQDKNKVVECHVLKNNVFAIQAYERKGMKIKNTFQNYFPFLRSYYDMRREAVA